MRYHLIRCGCRQGESYTELKSMFARMPPLYLVHNLQTWYPPITKNKEKTYRLVLKVLPKKVSTSGKVMQLIKTMVILVHMPQGVYVHTHAALKLKSVIVSSKGTNLGDWMGRFSRNVLPKHGPLCSRYLKYTLWWSGKGLTPLDMLGFV